MPSLASLHARGLRLALGRTEILHDVDLDVTPGRRIGLDGPNGVGKSTLLRVLGGLLRPDRGTVSTTPPDAIVGYLPQDRDRAGSEVVRDFVARRVGVSDAQRELDAATAALAVSEDAATRYSAALDRWLAL